MESRITKLPNGATFIFAQHDTPSYAVMPIMRVGSIDEVETQPGLAHFVEHMLFQGSPVLPLGELMFQYEDRYCQQVNATTKADETILLSSCIDNFYFMEDELISGFLPVIKNAFDIKFEPRSVAQERKRIVSEIRLAERTENFDLEKNIKLRQFKAAMYDKPWMAMPKIIGDVDNAEATTVDDLKAFHGQYYGCERLVICCEGPKYPADLVAALTDALSAAPKGSMQTRQAFRVQAAEGGYISQDNNENFLSVYLSVGLPSVNVDLTTGVRQDLAIGYLNDFWRRFIHEEKGGYTAGIGDFRDERQSELNCWFPYKDQQSGLDLWKRFVDHIDRSKDKPDNDLLEKLKRRRIDYQQRNAPVHGSKNNRNYSGFVEVGTPVSTRDIATCYAGIQTNDIQYVFGEILSATPAVYSTCAPGQQLEQPKIAEILKAAAPSAARPTAPRSEPDQTTQASPPGRPSPGSRPGGGTAYSDPR